MYMYPYRQCVSLPPSLPPSPPSSGFSPLWLVLKDMVEQVSTMHSQFVQLLSDLGREVLEYNSSQKDKLKSSVSHVSCLLYSKYFQFLAENHGL